MKPEDYGIKKYKFNPDGTLDVFQNVYLNFKRLKKLPFKFGKIDGWFSCSYNNLKDLKGAPKIVNGNFYCIGNYLKSLKGSPKIVNGGFWCNQNELKSLNGLNLDNVSGKIFTHLNSDLKFSEKEQLWMMLNPEKLILNRKVV